MDISFGRAEALNMVAVYYIDTMGGRIESLNSLT
jgi:hypothetical protein